MGSDDTITSSGADSINSGAGNDKINVNGFGTTVTSSAGSGTIEISAQVKDVTISDLSSTNEMTISGIFEFGAAKIEDMLLVIADKTDKRKIKLADFETAKDSTVNVISTGLGNDTIAIEYMLDAVKRIDGVVSVNVS